MDFDRVIDRFGSHSVKWDMMETLYNVPAQDGIAMWVLSNLSDPLDPLNH